MLLPWLWPYGGDCARFEPVGIGVGGVAYRLNQARSSVGIHIPEFTASNETLGALDYERQVHAGEIPTRDLAHDWYNGLVWLGFPQAKQQINTHHIVDSQSSIVRSSNGRSRFRDALTLFDESGAVLLTTDAALVSALLNHDWQALFVKNRSTWADRAQLLIVGHGLLDSMHRPHKGLCAKVIPVLVPRLDFGVNELQLLALKLINEIRDSGNFSPMPVMGVPGWFDESNAAGFYRDTSVYRAKPTRGNASSHERLAFTWDGSTLCSGKCAGQSLPEFQGEESPDSSEHGAG